MRTRLKLALAATAAALLTGAPAAAQDAPGRIHWSSEANRAWLNGVTQAELQSLVAEAGGSWTDLPDEGETRVSQIDFPDLAGVLVQETDCIEPERPIPEQNCGTMVLSVATATPTNIEGWWGRTSGWVSLGQIKGRPALYRMEHPTFGTSRGHVLSTLTLFRSRAVYEMALIASGNENGW